MKTKTVPALLALLMIFSLPMTTMATTMAECGEHPSCKIEPTDEVKIGPETGNEPAELKILEITRGEEVDIKAYLVQGKTTIVDFFSPFCPPCMKLKPHIEAMVESSEDMALRLININRDGVKGIDWTAPVVAQYGISGVPHFKIYGSTGDLVAEGDDAYQKIYELISDFQNKK